MTSFIEVSVEGQDKWLRRIQHIAEGLADFTKLGEALTPVVWAHLGDWFDSKGDGSWEPLSEEYAAWKAVHYPGAPLMVLTGDLGESMHGNGEFAVMHNGRDGAAWGTRVPYAKAHQHGSKRGLPARPLIKLNDSFRRDFITASRVWMRTYVRAA